MNTTTALTLAACALLALAATPAQASPDLADATAVPYCTKEVQTNCWHETAPGLCLLYVGGANGACIIWEN